MSHPTSARRRRPWSLVTACFLGTMLAITAPASLVSAAHPTQVATPGIPARQPLSVLSCASSRSCWAVDFGGTVAVHWDGTQWTSMPLSLPAVMVHALTCLSDRDCWAVGYRTGARAVNLAVHWNGVTWSAVPAPNPKHYTSRAPHGSLELNAVACTSRTNCWSVGDYRANTQSYRGHWLDQILRWNGIAWSQVPVPQPGHHAAGASTLQLESLACAGSSVCWAVGHYTLHQKDAPGVQAPSRALMLGWNGTRWSIHRNPLPGGTVDSALRSVACPSKVRCFAVGGWGEADSPNSTVARALVWNGSRWVPLRAVAMRALQPSDQAVGSSGSSVNCGSATDCWVLADWHSAGF